MSCSRRAGVPLAAILLVVWAATARAQTHLLKVATLAPEGSSWVKAVRAVDAEVRQRTDGAVGLKVYPGGVQGDEDVMLRKIRIGQLQGGGFTGLGVSQACTDVLALEVPFLFRTYEEIDYVLDRMDGYYRQAFQANGFALLHWADIGFVYILSRDPVRGVGDLTGRKVWRLEGEPITAALFRRAGVTSVPLSIPDVLLGLQTRLVDIAYASPSAAVVLQWFTRVRYITELPINYVVGALVLERRAFEALAPDQQQALVESGRTHLRQQMLQNRRDNDEAVRAMQQQGLQWASPDGSEVERFHRLVEEALPDLVGQAFSVAAFQQIAQHLAAFRQAGGSHR